MVTRPPSFRRLNHREAERGQPSRLVLRPEIGAESPVWDESGHMVELDTLPIDLQLREDLSTWADVAWERNDVGLTAEGRDLHRTLVEQLGDSYEVVFDASDEPRDNLAGPARRFLGSVIDTVLVFNAIGFVIYAAFGSERSAVGAGLVIAVLVSAYEVVLTARWGRTLGKVVAGTRVIVKADSAVPGWRRSIVRWVVLSGPVLLIWTLATSDEGTTRNMVSALLINGWMIVVMSGILWNSLEQGLHDKAAGTIVVRSASSE